MNNIFWLKPIFIDFSKGQLKYDDSKFLKILRSQVRSEFASQNIKLIELKRSVYIIRMTGQFIVSYVKGNSPVLYVGRGIVGQRIAAHLKNWLSDVHTLGGSVGVEIRVCVPRKQNRDDFFKNVESDLIANFNKKHDSLPFFNKRKENKHARKVVYNSSTKLLLNRAIGIGSGKRPLWAIKPTPANKNLSAYLKGTNIL